MAWTRESLIDRAKKKVDSALNELKKEEDQIQEALGSMSKPEWEDFIKDMEELLRFKDKHNISMAGDQWDEIQWNRLNKIRKALGLEEVGTPFEIHHV